MKNLIDSGTDVPVLHVLDVLRSMTSFELCSRNIQIFEDISPLSSPDLVYSWHVHRRQEVSDPG